MEFILDSLRVLNETSSLTGVRTLDSRTGPDLAGGRPGAQPGHNFDLKSGGTKQLEAPKVPRIEMPKASRWMMNREGHPSQPLGGV